MKETKKVACTEWSYPGCMKLILPRTPEQTREVALCYFGECENIDKDLTSKQVEYTQEGLGNLPEWTG